MSRIFGASFPSYEAIFEVCCHSIRHQCITDPGHITLISLRMTNLSKPHISFYTHTWTRNIKVRKLRTALRCQLTLQTLRITVYIVDIFSTGCLPNTLTISKLFRETCILYIYLYQLSFIHHFEICHSILCQ